NSGFWNFIVLLKSMPPGMAGLLKEGDATQYALLLQNIFKELSYFALWQGLFILLYYSFWESSKFQATPGKLAARIRVMNASGDRISFLRALGRNLCKIISGIILLIGYMMAGWTEKKQALHDLITDCVLVRTEAVHPATPYAYAGFWRRFVAWILDAVLVYIIVSPINFIFLPAWYKDIMTNIFKTMREGNQMPIPPINDIILVSVISTVSTLIHYLYFASWESSKHQATPGKLAIGIKVVDIHGQRLSFWRASGRYANKIMSGITLLIGYMMAGWTEKKQALHDEIADCLVIKQQ
ncbi:MAG TPA: RDD family protein, partial [Bacteroidia bacterium]|nr:RDD family protein [Bacteroidia bacterium]